MQSPPAPQGQKQKQVKRQQGQQQQPKQGQKIQVQQQPKQGQKIQVQQPKQGQKIQVQQQQRQKTQQGTKSQTTNIIKPVGQLPQPQQQTNPVYYVLKTIIDFIRENQDPNQQRAGVENILAGAQQSYSKKEMQQLRKIVQIIYP
jgi:hypothetical protein